jgi:hypothetical protein
MPSPTSGWSRLFAAGLFDRLHAPVGAQVGENLGGVGEQVAEEHAGAVERVVFGGDDVGRALAVPVERGIEDGFEEIAVGEVVGPLALALETGGDGIVAVRLLAEPISLSTGLPTIRSRAISAIFTLSSHSESSCFAERVVSGEL